MLGGDAFEVINYAICKLKNEFAPFKKKDNSLVKRRRKGVFLAFASWLVKNS